MVASQTAAMAKYLLVGLLRGAHFAEDGFSFPGEMLSHNRFGELRPWIPSIHPHVELLRLIVISDKNP
jgi:hypothetical protein